MADKPLTMSEWSQFAKGRELKDPALVKALAAREKANEPDELIEALAACTQFAGFVRARRRPLSDQMGRQFCCDGAARAVAAEVQAVQAQY